MSDETLIKDVEAIKTGLEAKFNGLQAQLKALQDDGASKAELQKAIDSITKVGEQLKEFEETQTKSKGKFFDEQFKSFLTTNKEKITDIQKAGSGIIEFKPNWDDIDKAVADIVRANGTIGTVPAWNDVSLPNVDLRNDNPMLNFANVYRTNSASQPYTEITGGEGDAEAVGEGGNKPQIDFDWNVNYATPYKVAAYEVLSEEVVQDIPRMMAVARDYLKQKHDLKKVDLVYFGDGTGVKPKGATVYGTTFDPVAALTAKVENANILDVINASILSVYSRVLQMPDWMPFIPNLVMLNPADFALHFVMAKDGNGLPLFPQASMFQRVNIGGVTIVPWVKVPTGKIFVSDMKKYNVGNYIPYFVKIGWINDQLIHNMFTMVGESRFFAYVKAQDEKAFLYDDHATITTSILKP